MDELRRHVERRVLQELARLDELILAADREIEELQCALQQARQVLARDRALSDEEQQQCLALREAGLGLDEIARYLRTTEQRVNEVLNQFDGPEWRAA